MVKAEKHKVAYRLTSRASTGLDFIRNYLSRCETTDTSGLRSVYILFSFAFELILKSRVVMLSPAKNEDGLRRELQNLSHNLKSIGEKLGQVELTKISILAIRTENEPFKKYIVDVQDKNAIDIYDFIDVRYDFFNDENGKERLRSITNDENSILKGNIDEAYKILKLAKQKNEE